MSNIYKRVIASLLIKDGLLVQSVNFKKFLPIGKPNFTIDLISRWDIDEIFLLNISKDRENKKFENSFIKQFAKKCFVPLTVGGGVKSINYAKKIISCGADKILINSSSIENPKIIGQLSKIFGSQCVVVGIDIKKINGIFYIFQNSGKIQTPLELNNWIRRIQNEGAGEILINSIDSDGSKLGFDLSILDSISSKIQIPIVLQGGAGTPSHIHKALQHKKLSGCAVGNMFHFTEHSTIITKSYLHRKKLNIRFDNLYNYSDKKIDLYGRVQPLKYEKLINIKTKPSQKYLV